MTRASPSGTSEPDDVQFFARLPELTDFAGVTDVEAYHPAPASWQLVITDVRGSTRAIEAGRYRDVNALGVASIVAVCNALPDVELPYVFGGDGATLLVPSSRLEPCLRALRGVSSVAVSGYGLELRTGVVSVAALQAEGHPVRVARFRASAHVCLAMFAGSGFVTAERWIKDPATAPRYSVPPDGEADASFEGFECRWQPVESKKGAIVSLLVQANGETDAEKGNVYRSVLAALARVHASDDARPVSVDRLKLKAFGGDYSTEARLRSAARDGEAYEAAHALAKKKARVGRVLIGLGASAGGFDGASYASELVENTDFRKFDETLRMVLDLTPDEIQRLEAYLERERLAGHLVYGLHRAPSALVTCFVRSYAGNHLHFVDGADGGYALAAKQLKQQLRGGSKG
ncbi:MAG: DUF3095 domain-containing protein [Myxococcota bacterium]